jgi:tryptophanyl-tRNA synthetase
VTAPAPKSLTPGTMPVARSHQRVLTGDRPTGRLHLGHLVGSLRNRVTLQSQRDTILLIADLHVLTTKPDRGARTELAAHVRGIVLDYLASGIDPAHTSIFLQSAVPEICELNTLLENLVTVNRLARIPSLKEMARDAHLEEQAIPFGLLGYPVLQAADILLARAHLVPVGRDNVAHVEVTREIARRFNSLYGEVFPEPEPLLSEVPALVGTDGKGKMSKSAGNAIFLCDDVQAVAAKVRGMYTDPKRIHADIPGTVEGNPVFIYLDLFDDDRAEVAELTARYRAGHVGDGEVKERLTRALNRFLDPIRTRMATAAGQPQLVDEIQRRTTATTATASGGCSTTRSRAATSARAKPTFIAWRRSPSRSSISVSRKACRSPASTVAFSPTGRSAARRCRAPSTLAARPDSSCCSVRTRRSSAW